jgi:GAF domain-containing protein
MDWSIILSSCIVAGTTILSIFIKELVQAKKNKQNACVVKYTKQNENVQKALDYVLNEIQSDRAYIFEFHNGDHFYSGNHQQKFSCTYESLNSGVSSESMRLQDLRVSTFNSFVKDVLGIHGEKSFRLQDIEQNDHPLLRNWLEERGIRSSYAFPIETLNHGVVGILCLDFTKQKTKLTKDNIELLNNQAKIISGYLI